MKYEFSIVLEHSFYIIYSNLMYIAKIYDVVYNVVCFVVQHVIVIAKLMWSLMWSG